MWDGSRTGVSERLPSGHPVATSARGTDRRAGFVTEGSYQGAQSRVVFRLRWWKEGFVSMLNRNFARHLLPRLFRGALGNEGVCSVGFWEETLVLFLGRWYREWEEKMPWPMEFELCSLHVAPSNSPNLCI